MFRTVKNKGQIAAASIGILFLATVVVVPPWNDVCAFSTRDHLKTYRSAGFRPWWQSVKPAVQQAETSEYMEVNWTLWLLELSASLALASSAFVVFGPQHKV